MYVRDRASPFIHALNLDAPFAVCLDLPGAGYADDGAAMQWSLAMSPDGTRVYAVNLAAGTLAVVDAGSPQILRTIHFAQATSAGGLIKDVHAKEIGGNSALVSADGRTLVVAGTSGVVWIDTETLAVRARALNDWHIWSVGLSPDGQTVYAVSDGGKIAEISMGSARVGATFDLTGGQPLALMRVAES
jgi:DNA-binding beta-propeller fold protein YncE